MRTLIILLIVAATATAAHAAPGVHVTVSGAGLDDATRKLHADAVRRVLATVLESAGAASYGLDVSVVELGATSQPGYVEIGAQLRIVISDDSGRIVSIVSNGSSLQVPTRRFHADTIAKLHQEVLVDAAHELLRPLRANVQTAVHRNEPSV